MNEIKNEMKPIKYGHVLNKIKNSFYSHSKPQIQQRFNYKLIQRRFKKGLIKIQTERGKIDGSIY